MFSGSKNFTLEFSDFLSFSENRRRLTRTQASEIRNTLFVLALRKTLAARTIETMKGRLDVPSAGIGTIINHRWQQ